MGERKEPQSWVLPLSQVHADISADAKSRVLAEEERLVQKVRTEHRTPVVARTIEKAIKGCWQAIHSEDGKEKA